MTKLDEELEQIAKQGDAVISKIQEVCTLVTLRIHRWHGKDRADEVDINLKGTKVDKRISAPYWQLMPKVWVDKFQSIESAARATLNSYSIRSPIHGSRFVPIQKAEQLFTTLNVFRTSMNDNADEFCKDEVYQSMLANLKADLGDTVYDVAKHHLPDRKGLRRKFGMDWFVIPISAPGESLSANCTQYVQEAKRTLNKVIMESVETMVKEPRAKLAEAVMRLRDQINKPDRRVRGVAILSVKSAFEEYRNWAFMSDAQTLDALKSLDGQLNGLGAKEVNSNDLIAKELTIALGGLQDQLKDENAMLDGFHKFRRAVSL